MTELNWAVVNRIQSEIREWPGERLSSSWRDRHNGNTSTPEWIAALSREMDRRGDVDGWEKFGRHYGVSESEMNAWVAFVESCADGDLMEDIYRRFRAREENRD